MQKKKEGDGEQRRRKELDVFPAGEVSHLRIRSCTGKTIKWFCSLCAGGREKMKKIRHNHTDSSTVTLPVDPQSGLHISSVNTAEC